MSIHVHSLPKFENPLVYSFPTAFAAPPVVLATPFWAQQNQPVGGVETVTDATASDCHISSGNLAPSGYSVNALAIAPGPLLIGGLRADAGSFPKPKAGKTTINFGDRLTSNDPVVLLSPRWTSVVSRIEHLYASAASEIVTYSENAASDYFIQYLAVDRGSAALAPTVDGYNAAETGTYNKTGAAAYRVYFDTLFTAPPVVFLSSWWDDEAHSLGFVETLTNVTPEYFEAVSANWSTDYFVNWMAFGNVSAR
jgi:hypothetical protein